MASKVREMIARSLVKEIRNIPVYPSYENDYFRSFNDVNVYFTEMFDENWTTLEWAKVWLYEEDQKKPRSKRQQHAKTGIQDKIKSIYADHNYDITMYRVHSELLALGVEISKQSVYRHCRKIVAAHNLEVQN